MKLKIPLQLGNKTLSNYEYNMPGVTTLERQVPKLLYSFMKF